MRLFAQIDLGHAPVPDETTILKFRHLLERISLGLKILREVNVHLVESGIKLSRGTIVDATVIHAPSSTKNESGKRDPEMHQTKKGNEWYFGMKAHIGIDTISVRAWLEKNGGNAKSAKFVEIPTPQMGSMIARGVVDAAVLASPLLYVALAQSSRVLGLPYGAIGKSFIINAWYASNS